MHTDTCALRNMVTIWLEQRAGIPQWEDPCQQLRTPHSQVILWPARPHSMTLRVMLHWHYNKQSLKYLAKKFQSQLQHLPHCLSLLHRTICVSAHKLLKHFMVFQHKNCLRVTKNTNWSPTQLPLHVGHNFCKHDDQSLTFSFSCSPWMSRKLCPFSISANTNQNVEKFH